MSLGPLELAMLAAIALLFFGPAKLPQLGKSIGEAIRGFKGAMSDMNNEINKPEPNSEKSTPKPPSQPTASEPETEAVNQAETKRQKRKRPGSVNERQ
jgi:sec-independent protein translocase protein TatA